MYWIIAFMWAVAGLGFEDLFDNWWTTIRISIIYGLLWPLTMGLFLADIIFESRKRKK